MLQYFRRERRREPRAEETWRELIANHARGATFIDVGCLWNVHGAYAFHAAAHGAKDVVGLDPAVATEEFKAENAGRRNVVRFVHGDINDPRIAETVGTFDVVFCSGVLYHMPNPVYTLQQLGRICRRTLILTCATFPEGALPQAMVFLPHLDQHARNRLQKAFPGPSIKMGIDTEFQPERWYANWFWAFSPSAVRAMLKTAGFEILDFVEHGRRKRVVTAVCSPVSPVG